MICSSSDLFDVGRLCPRSSQLLSVLRATAESTQLPQLKLVHIP
jgi:hypothetical protein